MSSTFYEKLFCYVKKIQTQIVSKVKLLKTLLHDKDAQKMLVKLRP